MMVLETLFPDDDLLGPRMVRKRGHADTPGTGPIGETCKSCAHYCVVSYRAGKHRKCGAMQRWWTHGPGTDIRAGDPACSVWVRAD